eukprot:gene11260-21451_t
MKNVEIEDDQVGRDSDSNNEQASSKEDSDKNSTRHVVEECEMVAVISISGSGEDTLCFHVSYRKINLVESDMCSHWNSLIERTSLRPEFWKITRSERAQNTATSNGKPTAGICSLREQVEDILIAENWSEEKVEEWGADVEARVERFEHTVEMTSNAISALDFNREKVKVEREREEEEVRLRSRFEKEKRLEEMRLQFSEQYQSKQSEEKTLNTQKGGMKVELPKLSITKFNGIAIDWMRFWNQFSTEIDVAKISNVSKFTYLKELLDSKVDLLIDGLPFTPEVYELQNLTQEPTKQAMLTSEPRHVTYPVVVVKINGVDCRALLDTGVGSSYASATLINRIWVPASRVEQRKIEMMMHTTMRRIQVYNLKISNCDKDFELRTNVSKIGEVGELVAEYTRFGWTITSPGTELDLSDLYLTRSTDEDNDRLCSLDVFGIQDSPSSRSNSVYEDYKQQLDYDAVIKEYLDQGIVQMVSGNVRTTGKVFYIPHNIVVRDQAESTKATSSDGRALRDFQTEEDWPEDITTVPSTESETEVKKIKDAFASAFLEALMISCIDFPSRKQS